MTTPTPKAFVVTKDDLDVLNANIAYARRQGDLAAQAVEQLMALLGKGNLLGGGTTKQAFTNAKQLNLQAISNDDYSGIGATIQTGGQVVQLGFISIQVLFTG